MSDCPSLGGLFAFRGAWGLDRIAEQGLSTRNSPEGEDDI